MKRGDTVIWLKTVRTHRGKEVQRVPAILVAKGKSWSTVEVDGKRCAALTKDLFPKR